MNELLIELLKRKLSSKDFQEALQLIRSEIEVQKLLRDRASARQMILVKLLEESLCMLSEMNSNVTEELCERYFTLRKKVNYHLEVIS